MTMEILKWRTYHVEVSYRGGRYRPGSPVYLLFFIPLDTLACWSLFLFVRSSKIRGRNFTEGGEGLID